VTTRGGAATRCAVEKPPASGTTDADPALEDQELGTGSEKRWRRLSPKEKSIQTQRMLAKRLKVVQDPYFVTMYDMEELERNKLTQDANTSTATSNRNELDDEVGGLPAETLPGWRGLVEEVYLRGQWLLGLLVLQSTSSFVLEANQDLIKDHLIITLFLTMLVGAGGNAGNQSAILVIRGLATKEMEATGDSFRKVMVQQGSVGLLLGLGLSLGGFVRVYLTDDGNIADSAAIALSLFVIVTSSVVAGAALPFGLAYAGLDPANAGTTIQVVMDIMGVTVTCIVCYLILDLLYGGSAAHAAAAIIPSVL